MIHKEVIALGTGGQGVVLLGRLIGMIATNAGFYSTQKAAYSSAVRGYLPVSCDVIISEQSIRFPFLNNADVFIAMNGAGVDKYKPLLTDLEVFLYDPTTVSNPISSNPIPVPAFPAIIGQKSVSGSPLGSPSTINQMLEFSARHSILPVTEEFEMSDVNDAFEHLKAGKARYRIVLRSDFEG